MAQEEFRQGGGANAIALQAREMAQKALQAQEAHERLCTERWEQARQQMSRLERSLSAQVETLNKTTDKQTIEIKLAIGGLWTRIWLATGGLIAFLVGVIIWLASLVIK